MEQYPNLDHWYNGLFITDRERHNARRDFTKFLSKKEKEVWSDDERSVLVKPLEDVPDQIRQFGAWVGKSSGGPQRPDVIVAGVCQGKTDEEKEQWLKWGPTIETICGLDSAAAVAKHFGSQLHLWIVSQEYANLADHSTGAVVRELKIGDVCHDVLSRRYPGAIIFNTSNREHRGLVYAAASETIFSRIYPSGVRKPYGIESPSFWDQLDYSSCLGSMVLPALDGLRVWTVVDHDQLRPASGAIAAFPQHVAALYYWPVPNLAWKRKLPHSGSCFFKHVRDAPRRMHRHSDHTAKLHLAETDESLARKTSLTADHAANHPRAALCEILSYLSSPEHSNESDCLISAMHSFRSQTHTVPP